jgi:hypothetical protein
VTRVIARQVEFDLSLDQILAIIRQLKPQEREVVRRAIEPLPWEQRLDALLTRVWARVEKYPISEEDIDAEVELVRRAIYVQR